MAGSYPMSSTRMDKFEYHKRFVADRNIKTLGQLRVLSAMWDFSDKSGNKIRPGRTLLTAHAGVSHSTVDSALQFLVDRGYLIRTDEGGRGRGGRGLATVYALGVPASWPSRIDYASGLAEHETTPSFGDVYSADTPPSAGGVTPETSLKGKESSPSVDENHPEEEPETTPALGDPSDHYQTKNRSTASDPAATDSKPPGSVAQQIADDESFEWKQNPPDDPWTSNYGSGWDWSTNENTA